MKWKAEWQLSLYFFPKLEKKSSIVEVEKKNTEIAKCTFLTFFMKKNYVFYMSKSHLFWSKQATKNDFAKKKKKIEGP